MIPFERHKWIANSFAHGAWEDQRFIDMLCNISISGIPIVFIKGLRGPIVVTWLRVPVNA